MRFLLGAIAHVVVWVLSLSVLIIVFCLQVLTVPFLVLQAVSMVAVRVVNLVTKIVLLNPITQTVLPYTQKETLSSTVSPKKDQEVQST